MRNLICRQTNADNTIFSPQPDNLLDEPLLRSPAQPRHLCQVRDPLHPQGCLHQVPLHARKLLLSGQLGMKDDSAVEPGCLHGNAHDDNFFALIFKIPKLSLDMKSD